LPDEPCAPDVPAEAIGTSGVLPDSPAGVPDVPVEAGGTPRWIF